MSEGLCINHGLTNSNNWKFTSVGYLCHRCFKSQKVRADILTTTSHRVQQDRLDNEKELIQPYLGDRINPEFVKNYPTHAPDYYHQKELDKLGVKKMKSRKNEVFKKESRKDI